MYDEYISARIFKGSESVLCSESQETPSSICLRSPVLMVACIIGPQGTQP